ncbi:MAG TPA: hypothetical protein VLQ80_32620, partial [Candidatus Saccharimonadia bacterium]|nr:hypothetical protein [Candidatus Saccharimonadia bacterium]
GNTWEISMSRVLIKSAWGSDDPTKAAFPFLHANAFAAAGHEVQIFLLGEGVSVMRTCVAEAIVPVGWPPLAEALAKAIEFGNTHPCLNGVLTGPWGPCSRPGLEERDVCYPGHPGGTGGMGREDPL